MEEDRKEYSRIRDELTDRIKERDARINQLA